MLCYYFVLYYILSVIIMSYFLHHLIVWYVMLYNTTYLYLLFGVPQMAGKKRWCQIRSIPLTLQHLGTFFKSNEAGYTLQETNISPKNAILKMIFLFPRSDMLIPWRVIHTTTEPSCLGTSHCVSLNRRKVPDPMGADIQRPPWSDDSFETKFCRWWFRNPVFNT